MIYVRDKGQMCNNILQYGHVYAFAREHGKRSVSMRFCYKYPYFKITGSRRHNWWRYVSAKLAAALHLIPVVSYDTPGEQSPQKERKILKSLNVVVQGWEVRFYDLFLKYRDEIRDLFTFRPEIAAAMDARLKDLEGESADTERIRIGVHVRRGDYARWQGGKYFYSDSLYARVATQAAALFPGKKISLYICGNDPNIDTGIFRGMLPEADVNLMHGNPAEDLYILSQCDYLVGAPSTYSLTAAFYRDIPLYWILDPEHKLKREDFRKFKELFKEII